MVPTETRFGSVDDVFSCFSSPACSWRTISVASKGLKFVLWCFCDLFVYQNLRSALILSSALNSSSMTL